MATTTVFYNGVSLENVVTREWDQEVVYDESGTDMVYSRFKLRFEGIIHFAGDLLKTLESPAFVSPLGGTSAVSVYQNVRHLLSEPRRKLTVFFGNEIVLEVRGADPAPSFSSQSTQDIDVENGPKPRGVRLTHITGDQVFRVEFSIEACKLECNRGPTGVLNNRWGVSEAMDENFFITRTIRGRIKCSHANTTPHYFKPMVVPGLEIGFKRISVEFDATPDGLTADYTIIDRQVHHSAPWPATKMSGTHIVGTNDGVSITSEMSVRLDGAPASDKRLLIQRAVQICDLRLNFFQNFQQNNVLIEQAAVIDHIGEENAVEVRLRIKHTDADPNKVMKNIVIDTLGSELTLPALTGFSSGPATQPYNRLRSIAPEYYGYVANGTVRNPSVLFLLSCYLQDPCAGKHEIAHFTPAAPPTPQPSPPLQQQGTSLLGNVSLFPLSHQDLWSTDQKTVMYTAFRAESTYILRGNRVQLPIAQSRSAYQAGADTSVVVDLGLPTVIREIRMDGERVGEWPAFPAPLDRYTDGTLKGVLLDHRIELLPAKLSVDSRKKIFTSRAYYLYAMNRPPTLSEKVSVGVLPFTRLTEAETAFDLQKGYSGLALGQAIQPPNLSTQ